jgi:twitching motility protein PilT
MTSEMVNSGNMSFYALVDVAKREGASDLHLEPGLPPMIRVRGKLCAVGEPSKGEDLLQAARELIAPEDWARFQQQRSFDMSKSIEGMRCRINILQTSRGTGFAIRLLPAFQPTIDSLNLHPDLKQLVNHANGLVLISGPTGSGKSTTLAALLQTVNLSDARHIITVENPIEFTFRPQKSFIRQREVGRDTPSFEQALLDSLREDPDVLMVGELREPETMRLTLSAAETGHLVLATVHSSNCAEALQRVVNAFPPEIQSNVSAQLADCLLAVVSQRLQFRPNLGICVPELEILKSSTSVKNFIRNRDFFKIASSLETGVESGMWTFTRYRNWLDKRTSFHIAARETEEQGEDIPVPPKLPAVSATTFHTGQGVRHHVEKPAEGNRIEIEPVESFDKILKPRL